MKSVFDEISAAVAHDPDIAILHGALSPGDRSILPALLDNEAGVGTTMSGSANDQFWHCLSEHGWMAQSDSAFPDAPIQMINYRITDRGFRAIPALLCKLSNP